MDFRDSPPVTGGLAQAAVVDNFDIEDELDDEELDGDTGDDNAA